MIIHYGVTTVLWNAMTVFSTVTIMRWYAATVFSSVAAMLWDATTVFYATYGTVVLWWNAVTVFVTRMPQYSVAVFSTGDHSTFSWSRHSTEILSAVADSCRLDVLWLMSSWLHPACINRSYICTHRNTMLK